ncbi:MAG: hypothetical protein LBP71_01555 [Spirochaetaceae bacterium]|jgi:hypothetical protein|nr:hypothetical protein [Spirochaetaceae bacterium]
MAQETKLIPEYCSRDVVDCFLEKDPETYRKYRDLYEQARNYGRSIAFRVMDKDRELPGTPPEFSEVPGKASEDLFAFAKTLGIKKIYFWGTDGTGNGVYANLAEYDETKSSIGINLGLIHSLQPLLYTYYGVSTELFKKIVLAHELFHHLEQRYYTETDVFLRDRLSREGLKKGKAPIKPVKRLREFAAAAFAETLLDLPFPAQVIDILRLCKERGEAAILRRVRRIAKMLTPP